MHRFLSCCSVFVTKFQLEIPSRAKRLYVDRTRNNSVPESMFTRLEKWGVGGVENMGVDLTVGSKAVSSPVALEVGGCRPHQGHHHYRDDGGHNFRHRVACMG